MVLVMFRNVPKKKQNEKEKKNSKHDFCKINQPSRSCLKTVASFKTSSMQKSQERLDRFC